MKIPAPHGRLMHWQIAVVTVIAMAVVHGQQARFASGTASVRLEVSAFDDHGTVAGLTRADFEVTDSGTNPDFSVQELIDLPFDMVVVSQPYASLHGAQVSLFQESMRILSQELGSADRFGALLASHPPKRVRPLAPGPAAVDAGLFTGAGDEVALLDTIAAAFAEFPMSDRRKVLLVIADGIDRRSILSTDMVTQLAAHMRPQVVFLGSAPTLVDSVTFRAVEPPGGASNKPSLAPLELAETVNYKNAFPSAALRAVAENTGGQIVDLMSKDPRKLVTAMVARLRCGYLITYMGSGSKGWHPVNVRVKKRGVTLATRAGYFID